MDRSHDPCTQVLGVGFPYIRSLPATLYAGDGPLDFVELTPEELCRERRTGGRIVFDLVPRELENARAVCGDQPIVVHGVELSIGSADGWNHAYVDMLDELAVRWPFQWHSEHLGFQTISTAEGTMRDVGVPLPLPLTEEAVTLVAERARYLAARYGVPFLLENAAHYLPRLPSDTFVADEAAFMQRIVRRSGCGQLLDLHNLYCNALNQGFDPFEMVARFPLDEVVEIHVAGGASRDGFWMDSHSDRVPHTVWELLDAALPRCPRIAGVVYEILEETASHLPVDAIEGELATLRAIWTRHLVARLAESGVCP